MTRYNAHNAEIIEMDDQDVKEEFNKIYPYGYIKISRLQNALRKIQIANGLEPVPASFTRQQSAKYREIAQSTVKLIEQWSGSLVSWVSLPLVPEAVLGRTATYSNVEAPLVQLLRPNNLTNKLPWANGSLMLGASYDENGKILSLKAAVGLSAYNLEGQPLVLELTDALGDRLALSLTPGRPSDIVREPFIVGRLETFTLKISIGILS